MMCQEHAVRTPKSGLWENMDTIHFSVLEEQVVRQEVQLVKNENKSLAGSARTSSSSPSSIGFCWKGTPAL